MTLLSKTAILAAQDLQTEDVEVPGLRPWLGLPPVCLMGFI